MLSTEQLRAREGKLTASAVGALMSGNALKIHSLWQELVCDPNYERPDLSYIWAINLGETTEQLNLDWYERRYRRKVTHRGDVLVHKEIAWAAATLDGWIEDLACPIEAKHVGGNEPIKTVLKRYQPQFHWQMLVTDSDKCVATIIEAAQEPKIIVVRKDEAFSVALMERAEDFMGYVSRFEEPPEYTSIKAPIGYGNETA